MQKTNALLWTDISYNTGAEEEADMLFSSPEAAIHEAYTKALEKMMSILNLRDNWDGEDARAPEEDITQTALMLFHQSMLNEFYPSRISPTHEGSIVFEWQANSTYLQAEVEMPYRIDWMERDQNGKYKHWSVNLVKPPATDELVALSTQQAA
ncbi:MAG: hypothetical protein ACOY5W_07535 [Pseudomonadota bacterium]